MKRASAFLLAPLLLVLTAPACSDHHHDHGGGGFSQSAGTGGSSGGGACEQYTTCGGCTPVDGCGWCSFPGGTGACVSDPDQCDTSQQFGWTWDSSGCTVVADAGIGPSVDAAPPTPVVVDAALPVTSEGTPDSDTTDAPAAN